MTLQFIVRNMLVGMSSLTVQIVDHSIKRGSALALVLCQSAVALLLRKIITI